MKRHGEAFVGIDTAKARNAVAVAESGRGGEIRYLGEFDNTPDAVIKLVRRMADRYETVHFCYEVPSRVVLKLPERRLRRDEGERIRRRGQSPASRAARRGSANRRPCAW